MTDCPREWLLIIRDSIRHGVMGNVPPHAQQADRFARLCAAVRRLCAVMKKASDFIDFRPKQASDLPYCLVVLTTSATYERRTEYSDYLYN